MALLGHVSAVNLRKSIDDEFTSTLSFNDYMKTATESKQNREVFTAREQLLAKKIKEDLDDSVKQDNQKLAEDQQASTQYAKTFGFRPSNF